MNFYKILLLIGIVFTVTSCSTTEKFNIYAPQDTKIYTPDNIYTPKGIAPYNGKIKVEIPSNMFCGFILAQSPESDVKIPIGLDFNTNRHTGTKIALYTGSTIAWLGIGATAIGGIAMIAANANKDDESSDLFGVVTGVGALTAGLGAAVGWPSQERLRQTSYDYNFGYVSNQRIHIPDLSFTLLNPNPPKRPVMQSNEKRTTSRKKASSGKGIISEKSTSSKVNSNRSDNSRIIEGEYVGNGKLFLGKNVDEEYSDISVIMERVDKNHVKVRIIEGGDDYFDSPLIYEIHKGNKGIYNLKIENLPEAIIQITPKGKLTFNHNKVNIENRMYSLEIVAEKK